MAWNKSMTQGETGLPGLAGQLYTRALGRLAEGTLDVEFPDGSSQSFGNGGTPHAELRLHRPLRLLRRLLIEGDVGFADGYIAGDWQSRDLTALLILFTVNETAVEQTARPSVLAWLGKRLRHRLRSNTRIGSRRNIAAHYDLGNAFYQLWLDPSMTYSSAVFGDSEQPQTDRWSLEQAQAHKYQRILDRLEAQPGERLLEIGCGWGGFALEAARRGVNVTGLTLSREQLDWAQNQAAQTSVQPQPDYQFRDYREETGQYDRIASIEMFEAVGEAYWPGYFETLHRCLRPGGRAALQVITIDSAAFEAYRRNPDFIQLYIFPGGMLPTREHLGHLAQDAGLRVHATDRLGLHYAETLRLWHERFNACRDKLQALGFDEGFMRMWRYYLSYCEAGFRTGRIDLAQITLERPEAPA